MKQLVALIESISGFESVLFCFFLICFDVFYVKIAAQPHGDFEFYAAAWAMSILTSLLAIKTIRHVRERLHKSAG